jgi:hypothetical protein
MGKFKMIFKIISNAFIEAITFGIMTESWKKKAVSNHIKTVKIDNLL